MLFLILSGKIEKYEERQKNKLIVMKNQQKDKVTIKYEEIGT